MSRQRRIEYPFHWPTAFGFALAGLALNAGCTSNGDKSGQDGDGDGVESIGATDGLEDGDADNAEADEAGDADDADDADDAGGMKFDSAQDDDDGGNENPPPGPFHDHPNLWYSAGELLVYIELDPADGTVASLVAHELENVTGLDVASSESAITMLSDGTLLGAKLHSSEGRTEVYQIAAPPEEDTPQTITPVFLGNMPDSIMVEGLYTGCEDRLYAMDTGTDTSSADGNRLLEFTADVLAGDLTHVVVSDLSTANVADIDDMAPGIDEDGDIRDTPGLAIDSGTVHEFDYVLGSGTEATMAGTFGIHTISGELFDDGRTRVYVLDADARLYELDPDTWTVGPELVQGPDNQVGPSLRGNAGLTGPAPSCVSSFPPPG